MRLSRFDHIVLAVNDLEKTLHFYSAILGMTAKEERPGKFSLHFGESKISLQRADALPEIAKGTVPGSANFCVTTVTSMSEIVSQLKLHHIDIIEGPGPKLGAKGEMESVYFRDPDDNLVEICVYRSE